MFKSDRFLSHRFVVRLTRMQVPSHAQITKRFLKGIRKPGLETGRNKNSSVHLSLAAETWEKIESRDCAPPPLFRISNNRRGKIETARWGFKGGDENDGSRGVCAREGWSGRADWSGQNHSRVHRCIIHRARAREIIAGTWFLSHFALTDKTFQERGGGGSVYLVHTPLQ